MERRLLFVYCPGDKTNICLCFVRLSDIYLFVYYQGDKTIFVCVFSGWVTNICLFLGDKTNICVLAGGEKQCLTLEHI